MVTREYFSGRGRQLSWGRKDEEYIADFCLVSRRTLNEQEDRIFRFYFLLGADWKLCCRRLQMDRGNLFHAIYRIQQKLGRVFAELEPYALFPVDGYFNSSLLQEPADIGPKVVPIRSAGRQPLRPPVKKLA